MRLNRISLHGLVTLSLLIAANLQSAQDGSELKPIVQKCAISVIVKDSAGNLTKNAQVVFVPRQDKSAAASKGKTDGNGEFKTKLMPGNYSLQAAFFGFRRYDENVKISCEDNRITDFSVQLELAM